MSESRLGVACAEIRQKAGRSLKFGPGAPAGCAPGSANVPAATVCTLVILMSGTRNDCRLSHGAADAIRDATVHVNTAARRSRFDFMRSLPGCRLVHRIPVLEMAVFTRFVDRLSGFEQLVGVPRFNRLKRR